MAKNKHLADTERLQIEIMLKQGSSLKRIAAHLDKTHPQFHGKSKSVQRKARSSQSIILTIALINFLWWRKSLHSRVAGL